MARKSKLEKLQAELRLVEDCIEGEKYYLAHLKPPQPKKVLRAADERMKKLQQNKAVLENAIAIWTLAS